MSETTYLIHQNNPEDYCVINQTGVRQALVNEPKHNACWDSYLAPDGSFYFSVCSELTVSEYAKLYQYDYEKNEARELFYVYDVILRSDRYIRDSKFHTSICALPDGRLIMVTHTTDRSPYHKAWLPYAFVSHAWEGFAGSELIIYDPKTNKIETKGIVSPRETIYGAVYSPKDNAYYMLGYMRGHLYRYDLATNKCADLGQASEYRCYRLVIGPDENVYFSTRSGFLMRYNVDLRIIEDLGVRIPCDKGIHEWPYTYMGPCLVGPDGRMYMTGNFTDTLSAYNVKTGKMDAIGKMIPADEYVDQDQQHAMIPGMAFDKYGVLWYCTMSFRDNEDEYYKVPSMLFRWDVLGGGKPECLGLFGTPDRIQTHSVNMYIDKEKDILYSVSTNHSFNSPDVIAIDLTAFRDVCKIRGPVATDKLIYSPGDELYRPFADGWHNTKADIRTNQNVMPARKIQAVRLWKQVPMDEIADAQVRTIRWIDDETITGICGTEKYYSFTVRAGSLVEWKPVSAEEAAKQIPVQPAPVAGLPYHPGRKWRANATCECEWINGSRIVGTEDGFIARIDTDGSIYSIGPAVINGPIRAICSNLGKGIVYGVGGDVEDIGNVFRYDEKNGLIYLGYVASDVWNDNVGTCVNFVLSSCSLSADASKLAIGGCDRLACVFVLTLQ